MGYATCPVRIRASWTSLRSEPAPSAQSRLYSLVPRELSTIWRECLTGYINRLGWTHHVSPRALLVQEVVPLITDAQWPYSSAHMMHVFGAANAMSLNGGGPLSQEWSGLLGQLTRRSDLHLLIAPWWIGDLSSRRLLRATPAWCPACLSEWREKGEPIYQPLLWMLQLITICPRHKKTLIDRCSSCHKRQPVIVTNKARPGECTHCVTWLGNGSDEWQKQTSDAAIQTWQEWVVATLEELHTLSRSFDVFRWEPFFASLTACLQERGGYTNVARMTGMRREVLYRWKEATYTPSLEAIFKLCYVFDVTPVQIVNNQTTKVRQALESGTGARVPQFRRHHRRVDLERCQAYLQAVLDGREKPLCFRQITQHLGYAERQLYYHFPRECAVIASLMREYRKLRQEERLNQIREQVRQAAMTLHAQGIYPSQRQLRPLLPGGLMRLQEAKEAWLATLHELGFEPRNVRHTHVGAAPAL